MPAAPLTAIRSSLLCRSRAPIDDLGAWEDGGAHRESDGGGRGVWKGSEASHRRRPRTGERSDVRLRLNPMKSRPQRELDDTYCFGGTRRRSWTRRRRVLRSGGGVSRRWWLTAASRGWGEKAGLCSGLYRPASGGNRERKRADWGKKGRFPTVGDGAVAFHTGAPSPEARKERAARGRRKGRADGWVPQGSERESGRAR